MRTRHLARPAAVAALVTAAALALAGPASAATPAPATAIDESGPAAALHGKSGKACVLAARAWTDQAVAKRLVQLDALQHALDQATAVTDAHRSTLEATYAADRAGLKAVRTEVRHDSTCTEATKDAGTVVTRFRVYVLLTPQTSLTIRADGGMARSASVENLEPGYAETVASLPDGPRKTAAQALLDELGSDVDAAQAAYGGIAEPVLSLVPKDFPSHAAVLVEAAADAEAGRVALIEAAADRAALETVLG